MISRYLYIVDMGLMVGRPGDDHSSTEKCGEGPQHAVVIRHVIVPDAQVRLLKALELLLDDEASPDETICGRLPDTQEEEGCEEPAGAGDDR